MNLNLPSEGAFHWENGTLFCEQLSLKALGEKFGSPLYVYSKKAIVDAFQHYEKAASSFPHLICYAVKANSSLAIINLLSRLGAGFDIVSGGELDRVMASGANPHKVVFSGVGKSEKEIIAALEAGIYCLNIESEQELDRVIRIAREIGIKAPISFRLNPNIDAKTHPYISTGLKKNKFGIAYDRALSVYRKAADASDAVEIRGMDCHIGSQITDIEPFLHSTEKLIDLIDELKTVGIELKHVDFGGGLGIVYDNETPPCPSELVTKIREILVKRGYENLSLLFEPGRSIVGDAGALLMQVEYLKEGDEKNFCVVNTAINDMIRPALYQAWMQIVPVDPINDPHNEKLWDVVGPVCETGDFLGKDRMLVVRPNDYLALMSAGAYGMSMSSSYNSRPRAAEVLVDADKCYLIRKRETYADLYRGESLIP